MVKFYFCSGEDLDQDLEGLIDDNPVEEDGEDEVGKDSEESELDDELEDDEIDLLEENLGIKIDRSVSITCRRASCFFNLFIFLVFAKRDPWLR